MKTINKILVMVLMLCMALNMGCIGDNAITGYTVDVGFIDGSYETYEHIKSYEVVYEGVFSDTVDLHTVYGDTIRLHYVTSLSVV